MPAMDRVAPHVHDLGSIRMFEMRARISEIEIKLTVGTKDKGVNRVIVLHAVEPGKDDFLLLGARLAVVGK